MAISLLPLVRCYSHLTLGVNRGQVWFQDVGWFGVLFRLNNTTSSNPHFLQWKEEPYCQKLMDAPSASNLDSRGLCQIIRTPTIEPSLYRPMQHYDLRATEDMLMSPTKRSPFKWQVDLSASLRLSTPRYLTTLSVRFIMTRILTPAHI
ncbi:hypothetical protein O0I10_008426 [Lichtheimia ornata]|uniref:Uncharacterized protein n=1 Tax=Lichtheimia ornata TaxID=688661 RepID=A0AAD7XX24_9FUNG|nr:uncharacterized protein O0I10_008426 [Lichtheimia ornata]KAJ8655986.1 hypothetical protein O0I10_008426 [Lichtheimia ornata]